MLVISLVILGLLVVPPLLFVAIFGMEGGGHPPPIIIPYLYVLFGFRFAAPVAAVLAFASAWSAFSRGATPAIQYGAAALGTLLCLASGYAWFHQFK